MNIQHAPAVFLFAPVVTPPDQYRADVDLKAMERQEGREREHFNRGMLAGKKQSPRD